MRSLAGWGVYKVWTVAQSWTLKLFLSSLLILIFTWLIVLKSDRLVCLIFGFFFAGTLMTTVDVLSIFCSFRVEDDGREVDLREADLRDTLADEGRVNSSKQLFLMFSSFFAYVLIIFVGISTISSFELKYTCSAFHWLGFSNWTIWPILV